MRALAVRAMIPAICMALLLSSGLVVMVLAAVLHSGHVWLDNTIGG